MTVWCFKNFDLKLFNIILLGICFMILFSAELAALNMQKTIISSIHDEKPSFNVEGYFVHGITYSLYATTLWLAPSIVCLTGPRLGMFIAGLGYTFYLLAFSIEEEWAMYLAGVVMGMSSAILWTAEGKYLILNSTPDTTSRNIGIFWFFYSSSEFYGNLIMYFQLEGKKFMDSETRRLLVYAMTGLASFSLCLFLFLRPVDKKEVGFATKAPSGPLEAFKRTWHIFTTKDMRILSVTSCYVGMAQAFAFGVYSPSVGFTLRFGNNAKQLVAMSGIFLGVGEMICGGLQVLFSSSIKKYKYGRTIIITIGLLLQICGFIGAYINLPNNSVFGNTTDGAYIPNSVFLAMTCSLLLGLADCCLNTQMYSLLAAMHPENSSQTCALYKFTKAVVKATSFYSSNHLGLYTHIHILLPCSLCGITTFYIIDRKTANRLWNEKKVNNHNLCQLEGEGNGEIMKEENEVVKIT